MAVLAGAGIGGHTIQVNKLASSAQHGFSYAADATNAGKLKFNYKSDAGDPTKTVTIAVDANATATDIATSINANDKAPVYAAVVKEGGVERLVFSSRKTGDNADFDVDTDRPGRRRVDGRARRPTSATRASTPTS